MAFNVTSISFVRVLIFNSKKSCLPAGVSSEDLDVYEVVWE